MSRFERWKHRVQTEQQLSADVKANYGASEAAQWEQKLNALGNRPWQRPEWEEMKKASVSVQLSIPERRRFEMALRQNQELRQFQDGSIVAISHVESKPMMEYQACSACAGDYEDRKAPEPEPKPTAKYTRGKYTRRGRKYMAIRVFIT